MMRSLLLLVPLALLSGCLSTVGTVVTAPVKLAAKTVDWTTTSQSEADRNRGKKIRKAEDRARKACRREVDGDYERELCFRERMRNESY
jgi:cytochrome bd-type quinol oxidase subunit 1